MLITTKPVTTKTEPIPALHPREVDEVASVYSGSTHDKRHSLVVQVDVISSSLHISRRARRDSILLAANHKDESTLGDLWRRLTT